MDDIKTLVQQGKTQEAIGIPEDGLTPEELFLRVSALLDLGKGEEAMGTLLRHRDALFAFNPLLTLKANFETRFVLGQFQQAKEDLEAFQALPYVSQRVEEALRALPSTIQATEEASKRGGGYDLEKTLGILASPKDDLELLSALNTLKKVGELEDYEGLVAETLIGPYHDDVKTYALMLLSAKGCQKELTLSKGGKAYKVVPAKLGTPYQLPEYGALRNKIGALSDTSLIEVSGELLDLYALIRYPERFIEPGETEDMFLALLALGRGYLGQEEGELSPKQKELRDRIEASLRENPPLLG